MNELEEKYSFIPSIFYSFFLFVSIRCRKLGPEPENGRGCLGKRCREDKAIFESVPEKRDHSPAECKEPVPSRTSMLPSVSISVSW